MIIFGIFNDFVRKVSKMKTITQIFFQSFFSPAFFIHICLYSMVAFWFCIDDRFHSFLFLMLCDLSKSDTNRQTSIDFNFSTANDCPVFFTPRNRSACPIVNSLVWYGDCPTLFQGSWRGSPRLFPPSRRVMLCRRQQHSLRGGEGHCPRTPVHPHARHAWNSGASITREKLSSVFFWTHFLIHFGVFPHSLIFVFPHNSQIPWCSAIHHVYIFQGFPLNVFDFQSLFFFIFLISDRFPPFFCRRLVQIPFHSIYPSDFEFLWMCSILRWVPSVAILNIHHVFALKMFPTTFWNVWIILWSTIQVFIIFFSPGHFFLVFIVTHFIITSFIPIQWSSLGIPI